MLILILTLNSQVFFYQLCSPILFNPSSKEEAAPWLQNMTLGQGHDPFVLLPPLLFWYTLLTIVHLVVNYLCTMSLTWYRIWTTTTLLFKVFLGEWHSIKTFCLKWLPRPKEIIVHHICKALTESMMATFNRRWSQPILRIFLIWTSRRFYLGHLCCV